MLQIRGFIRASHPAPTAVVTLVVVLLAWNIGWRDWPLAGIFITVLTGQLSVGWSNDAFDADLDLRSSRMDKPTVAAGISARSLWIAAVSALATSCALSWVVAGAVGGSWHVFALVMAWLYNTVLSRTWWSWLPYALAFGSIPAFLTYGFNGESPAWWLTFVCVVVGISAHIANALADIDSDRVAGVKGVVFSLGVVNATRVCWLLLAAATGVLALESAKTHLLYPVALIVVLVGAGAFARFSKRRTAMFTAILFLVVVDVIVLLISTAGMS